MGKYGKSYANIVGCSFSTTFRIVGMTRIATVDTGENHQSMSQEFTMFLSRLREIHEYS